SPCSVGYRGPPTAPPTPSLHDALPIFLEADGAHDARLRDGPLEHRLAHVRHRDPLEASALHHEPIRGHVLADLALDRAAPDVALRLRELGDPALGAALEERVVGEHERELVLDAVALGAAVDLRRALAVLVPHDGYDDAPNLDVVAPLERRRHGLLQRPAVLAAEVGDLDDREPLPHLHLLYEDRHGAGLGEPTVDAG